MIKWSRFLGFLMIVVLFFGLAIPTYNKIWNGITLGLDLKGGFDVLYQVLPTDPKKPVTTEGLQSMVLAIENRINSAGVAEPNISIEGTDRIRVQLAGVFDQNAAKKMIVQSADLIFTAVDATTGKPTGKPLATGKDIESNAKYVTDSQTGQAQVAIQFKDPNLWKTITTQLLQKQLGIVLDGKVISAPVVQTIMYDGKSVISGNFDAKSATQLANYLNAGALPYPMKELSSMGVSATLGAEALHSTLIAGLVAFALILVFMVAIYRLPGLIAMIALLMYTYLLFAVVRFMGITLTLPGLAALILGVGMAVDVNIIAIERMKDEFRNGKSLLSAVIMGQKRSLPTIIDANITSIIAGFIMYAFGTGQIKSFAVAHIISVLATFITAVMISRGMLQLLVRSGLIKNPWWYGAPRKKEVAAK
ncbi:MAG: protein translocase subunit SecD [Tumebacillaceae bacterium]